MTAFANQRRAYNSYASFASAHLSLAVRPVADGRVVLAHQVPRQLSGCLVGVSNGVRRCLDGVNHIVRLKMGDKCFFIWLLLLFYRPSAIQRGYTLHAWCTGYLSTMRSIKGSAQDAK